MMAKITALIHAHNGDASYLDRALSSLRVCDQVLVVNHGSVKQVEEVARQHGATVLEGIPGVSPGAYLVNAQHDWLLCLRPSEALSQPLTAALQQWKDTDDHEQAKAFSVALQEQTENGWSPRPPEARLVNRTKVNWIGEIPQTDPHALQLAGDLLHFRE